MLDTLATMAGITIGQLQHGRGNSGGNLRGQRFRPPILRQAQRLHHPSAPLTIGDGHPRHCAKPREVPTRPKPTA
eukprot:7668052-Pyramimonas_sp.AAC.1